MQKKYNKFQINSGADTPNHTGRIALGADNYKKDIDYETRHFTIGFEFYNEKLCELKFLRTSPLRKILENSKKFSKCTSIEEIKEEGIDLKRIANTNHYQDFFKGLEIDVELKEFDAGSAERAFLFIDPSQKIIQIIAMRNGHTENKKNKR